MCSSQIFIFILWLFVRENKWQGMLFDTSTFSSVCRNFYWPKRMSFVSHSPPECCYTLAVTCTSISVLFQALCTWVGGTGEEGDSVRALGDPECFQTRGVTQGRTPESKTIVGDISSIYFIIVSVYTWDLSQHF